MAKLKWRWSKVVVFLLGLTPLLWLGWRAWNHRLTANPIEFITHYTGDWTLRMVVIGLAITPLRKILNRPNLIRYRRMVGLFAFFYGCLHFTTWIWLDKFFVIADLLEDVGKRRYITVGFSAFALMIPLAVTSTAGWIRRMGGKRWNRLHQAIYVTAVLGVVHYYWLVKSDIRQPLLYAALVTLLLGWRIHQKMRNSRRTPAVPARKTAQTIVSVK